MPAISAIPAERCELVVAPRRSHDPELDHEIEAAWRAIRAADPQLFDGELLSVREVHVDGREVRLETEVTGYREFVVQRRAGIELGVRPLGVTGVTRVGAGVLLGRRSATVTQYPGLWEPVPAGSVSAATTATALEDQLTAELHEELGIDADEITAIALVGLVIDADDAVVDVCFALTVPEPAGRRGAAHVNPGEHDELRLCSPETARALAADTTLAVPTMAPMLRLALTDLHTA